LWWRQIGPRVGKGAAAPCKNALKEGIRNSAHACLTILHDAEGNETNNLNCSRQRREMGIPTLESLGIDDYLLRNRRERAARVIPHPNSKFNISSMKVLKLSERTTKLASEKPDNGENRKQSETNTSRGGGRGAPRPKVKKENSLRRTRGKQPGRNGEDVRLRNGGEKEKRRKTRFINGGETQKKDDTDSGVKNALRALLPLKRKKKTGH